MVRLYFPNTLVLAVLVLGACAKPEAKIVEVKGDCGDVFKSQVCTWARMQDTTVVAVGADVPIGSIANAPTTADMSWPPTAEAVLNVPAAAQAGSGFHQFTMYWEATGHPPGPYLTPHFDFHFYTISPADRSAITCSDTTKPAVLPAGYGLPDVALPPDMAKAIGVSTLVGLCVPQMGMHSAPTAELDGKDIFKGDMVIGYIHGKPIFIEPMISRSMLMEKKSFDLMIPEVPGLAGIYPRTFHATYDTAQQVYHFEFSGFKPGA
jgi:hypothetical protein